MLVSFTRKSSYGELLMFSVYPIFHDVGWSVASDNLIITFPINFRVDTMSHVGGVGKHLNDEKAIEH